MNLPFWPSVTMSGFQMVLLGVGGEHAACSCSGCSDVGRRINSGSGAGSRSGA